ncbi:MAG TPA: YlbF family regulator [Savagea sp.]
MTKKMYTRTEIIDMANKLGEMIASTEQVEFFKQAEAKINENQKVRESISSLKVLQQQAVNYRQYDKKRALEIVEEKIAKIEAEIDAIPIVPEFKQSQVEVNELLQQVTAAISHTVTKEIIESTGGDVLSGETGSYVRNAGPKTCSSQE